MVARAIPRRGSGAAAALAAALGTDVSPASFKRGGGEGSLSRVTADGRIFDLRLVEIRGEASGGPVARTVASLASTRPKAARGREIPLVVVPYMTAAGARACERAGVGWIDLSGNARIEAPGLRIVVEGKPNRFRSRGRPSSVFAPKSARVVRHVLMHRNDRFLQRDLARAVEMDEGFVSRIVGRMVRDGYLERAATTDSGSIRSKPVVVRDATSLLDDWREHYRFDAHRIVRLHGAARSGDELARRIASRLKSAGVEHAATGLTAAWQLTQFAAYRLATFFVADEPDPTLLAALDVREVEQGANLWLVVPNDKGVFQGAATADGVRCVHPVQALVDLKAHPERASEAAERLRQSIDTETSRG